MRLKPLLFLLSLSLLGAAVQANVVRPSQAIVSFTLDDLPVISGSSSAEGALGSAFNHQITGAGPATYTATGLPPGLSISASGLISGTPATFGNFTVNLTATNANGSSSTQFSLNISPWPVSSSTTNAVGATAGALTVDSSGAAIYDMPIFAPPGVGGIEPHLALKYSSNGANGLLGVGWSLSGLSMITRGASSKELYPLADTDTHPVGDVTAPLFNKPCGVVVDGSGNVYVGDTGNHVIRKISSSGTVTVFAGSVGIAGSTNGTGSAASFNFPEGLAIDSSGTLYVADLGNHLIRKITSAGVVTTLAGTAGTAGSVNGTGTAARFNNPMGVALDSAGNAYVSDMGNYRVRKITPAGVVTTLAGTNLGYLDGTGTNAQFRDPCGIIVDSSGNVFVSDRSNNTIRKITSAGVVTTFAGANTAGTYVDGTGTAARFYNPEGLTIDSSGNLVVADYFNHNIRKITPAAVVTTLAGSAGNPGFVDAVGTAAKFNRPVGVAVDAAGNVYVAEYTNNLVRKVTPATAVSTLAGTTEILSTDRYFLDGNRLEAVSGNYGANNSEYRTSVETFSRIIFHNDGTNPAWFEVWTKDGLRMELGNVAEARAGGTAVKPGAWLLNRVQDLAGNYLDVSYTVTNDSLTHYPYPNEIKYTGNGSLAPNNIIRFGYELRPDADKLHLKQTGLGGLASVDILHCLKTISAISLEGAIERPVRGYTLNYDTSSFTQRSRLTEIQESGINGTTLPKTTFTWSTDSYGFTSATTGTLNGSTDSLYAADFNGDGKSDMLRIGPNPTRATQLYLSTGTSLVTTNAPASFNLNPSSDGFDTSTAAGNDRLLVGDINGDGLPDIVATLVNYTVTSGTSVKMTVRRKVWIASVSAGTVSFGSPLVMADVITNYSVPNGTFTVPPAPLERLMDIDGSGQAALFTAQSSAITGNRWDVFKWNGTLFVSQTGGLNGYHAEDDIRLIDTDGDGVADLWLPLGGRIDVGYASKYFTFVNLQPAKTNLVLGDFNGDRLSDVLDFQKAGFISGNGRNCWIGSPNFVFSGDISSSAAADWNTQIISAVDLNRDGRDDLIIQRSGSSELWTACGDTTNPVTFTNSATITSGPLATETVMPIDFNGDGRTDLLIRGNPAAGNSSTAYRILLANGGSVPGDTITKVTNGLGATVDVAYASLTDPSVYTKGTATPAGLIDLQTPLQVVKMVTSDLGDVHSTTPTSLPAAAGTAATYSQTYKYEGLRSAPNRGVVGFAAQDVTDSRTSMTTRVERKQDAAAANYASNGFVTRTIVKRGTVILSDSVVTPALLSLNSGKTSLAYAQTATAKTWDISANLSAQGAMTSNQTVTQVLDSWGNPTSVTTTAGFGGRTTTQTNVYYPADITTGRWWISRLQTSTTLQQATGETDVSRAVDYYYRDNDGNAINDAQGTPLQVTKSIAFPSDAAKKLTTVYTYDDAFGHLTKLEMTGKKDASTDQTRTVAYAYDASGRFLITITHTGPNGNLVEDYIPDTLHGAPASYTDSNEQTTTYDYDDFCRLTTTTSPTNVTTTSSLAWQTDSRGIYSVETHATFLDSDGLIKEVAPPSFTVFDRLRRAVRQETMTADGVAVTRMETLYNALGAAWATSTPVRSGDPVYWNQVSFDALGRTQSQTSANGGAVSIAYNGTEITTTATGDYNSTTITKKARTVRDLQGRITDIYKNEGLGVSVEQDSISYLYDAAGNLKQTTAAGVVTSSIYDVRGLPVSLTDPNTGASSSVYNAFGAIYSTTDAKNQTATMDYDILGRQVTRSEAEGTTTWTYDSASGKGLGQLSSVTSPDGGGGTYTEAYTYDANFSRVASVQKTINNRTCTTVMGYDGVSRMASVTYQVSGGFADQKFSYLYNNLGALREVRDMSVPGVSVPGMPGTVQSKTLWSLGSVSVYGQPVDETFGNGVTSWTGYRATDGMLERRQVSNSTSYLENLKLGLDPFGNVRRRELCSDVAQNSIVRAEDYGIDLLDRLTSVKLNSTTSLTLSYDTQGNITNKSDVGNYSYSGIGAGPHAVTTAGSTTYGYDANGNLTKRNGVTENTWTTFDQPLTISRAGITSAFRYGPDRQRIQQITGETGGPAVDKTTTRYFGGGLEHVVQDRKTTCRYAVFTPGGRVAEISVISWLGETTRMTSYFASDHLGSVEAVTDDSGAVLYQLSYDAWGQRRNTDWTAGTPEYSTNFTRGYTDHEMLDSVGLVQMNGRVYDPVLARFLRSDPVVSDPMSAQTYNGYSYVGNNPLAATDPSGYVITHSFYSGGSNYGNYNFNAGGGRSNGFSFMGGTFSFSVGGGSYDLFENRFSSGNSAMIGMQARYMSLFGASSVFTGIPAVANANSYLSTANSGRSGNSLVQNIGYGSSGNLTGAAAVGLTVARQLGSKVSQAEIDAAMSELSRLNGSRLSARTIGIRSVILGLAMLSTSGEDPINYNWRKASMAKVTYEPLSNNANELLSNYYIPNGADSELVREFFNSLTTDPLYARYLLDLIQRYDRKFQVHHFLSNINRVYTPLYTAILKKYGLDLDGNWNKAILPQSGKHPIQYHSFILDELRKIDALSNGDKEKFLELFEERIAKPIRANPDLLYKSGWQ